MASSLDMTGVLLAGGQSRRMGGGDKCLQVLGERTMLAQVIARLGPQVARLVINANGPPERFTEYGLPVTADLIQGFAGPLAGVLTGMRWSIEHASQALAIITIPTDAPFLPMNLAERLIDASDGVPHRIVLAKSDGRTHPVVGLWPVALANDLDAALKAGVRKVLDWTDRHDTVHAAFPFERIGGEDLDPFFNANRPEELERARVIVSRQVEC